MEIHSYDKWGPLIQFFFNYEDNTTSLISLSDPRRYYGRSFIKGDKVLFRRIIIEGLYEGLLFKGHEILHEKGKVTVSLVKAAKIISKESNVKLDFDNPLDRALMEMGAIDILGNEI